MDDVALQTLTSREVQALRGAVWYAKYHAGTVAEHAQEKAAYAVAEREEYLDLVAALHKLGVRIRVPDALVEVASAAERVLDRGAARSSSLA